MGELEALVILTSIPYLGSIKIRMLLSKFGSAIDVLKASPAEIIDLPGFGPKTIEHWNNWKESKGWLENLKQVEKHHVQIIPFTNSNYPKRLLEIHDHPVLLYVKGELKDVDWQSLAVVGTRHASIYGREQAEKIAQSLASEGYTVVSGLARGIDTAAHLGALSIKNGRTIAVIGSGLARIYPPENGALAEKIAANGALISEYPMMAPPDRQNFPQRNRIVSGMTLGSVLIEAPFKSGAMITMEKAFSQGRSLFVVPGRVDDQNFSGNHALIKNGQGKLIEKGEDILACINTHFTPGVKKNHCNIKERPVLEKEEADLFYLLPNQELTIDEIVRSTQIPITKLNVLLMGLVLKKVIKEFPGKIYKKLELAKE